MNLCDGADFVKDNEGVELPDNAAARKKAVESLRGVMAGDLLSGELNTALCIEIEDEQHRLIETVAFNDAVTLRNDPHIRDGDRPSGQGTAGNPRNR